ncbi:hypothetical protein [Streptomyces sp. NPDC006997]|uniref:hypothetical protein n=1 Tax=Streptomyces sp. NPDC006997 TaxID=3155356 RepID=UPI0033DA32B0
MVACAVAGLPGQALAVVPSAPYSSPYGLPYGSPRGYAFAPDALAVPAATGTADAALLVPGRTFRSTLRSGAKAYFRLELGASENAYVSVTAVPHAGATLSPLDRFKVSLQDADGEPCTLSPDSAAFGAARSPRPVAVWGLREVAPDSSRCQGEGTYYAVVERTATAESASDVWDLELAPVTEPGLTSAEDSGAPDDWDSASPEPPTGQAGRRAGGEGFASAATIGRGVWSTEIAPGRTLFYKVPVGWGQQLSATAELAGATPLDGSGFSVSALNLDLYNPARGPVAGEATSYAGRQRSAALDPLPPVDHANRHAAAGAVSAMRFAGAYYLVVHLAAQVADDFGDGPFGLTLRVGIEGAAGEGPAYAGDAVPEGVFDASVGGSGPVSGGGGEDGAGRDPAMTALAVSGIGGGTLLLAGLGVWSAAARRRGVSA